MKYKVFVIDDEHDATENIVGILRGFNDLVEISGVSNYPVESVLEVKELKPDIIFLDIEMPNMNGFEFLNHFENHAFEVVFLTAFNQYAVNAFRKNAVDYLLKPLTKQDCKIALEKAIDKIKGKIINNTDFKQFLSDVVGAYSNKIAIVGRDGINYIKTSDIVYVKADESYSILNTSGAKFISSRHLSSIKKQLFNDTFLQVHQSFIINLDHVKMYNKRENYILMSNGDQVKVARRNKLDFFEAMKKFSFTIEE